MPHITIEHDNQIKNEIDLHALASSLHQNLAIQDSISLEAIKTRTIEIENVIVGDGKNNKMIHIELELLKGRSVELKEHMAQVLFDTAKKVLAQTSCALTVNICELGVYKK
jgi:5-carboxymethyl-2-hydroxymuconate isomerase